MMRVLACSIIGLAIVGCKLGSVAPQTAVSSESGLVAAVEDAAPGDARLALLMARFADAAYLAPAEFSTQAASLGAFTTERPHGADGVEWYVAHDSRMIVVAFRGTQETSDWLINGENFLTPAEARVSRFGTMLLAAGVGGAFHAGFAREVERQHEAVAAVVRRLRAADDRPVRFTGHSLGGATAYLMAWIFNQLFIPIESVHTFGAPQFANEVAMTSIDRAFNGKTFNFIRAADPVAKLPGTGFGGGERYGRMRHTVDLDGAAPFAAGVFRTAPVTDDDVSVLEGLRRIASAPGSVFSSLPNAATHAMGDSYIATIRALSGQ